MNAVTKHDAAEPAALAPIQSESAAIISMIERMASDPTVDIARLEKILELRERVEAKNAERDFNAAMASAQAEMPQVVRNADNEQTKSKYATLEKINAAMSPIISKHGFSMSFGTADSPHAGHYRIVCTTSHVGGHSREDHADVPIDLGGIKGNQNKTATHAFGSTMSYGRRYLTMMIFNVTTKKEDDDGNGGRDGYRNGVELIYPSEAHGLGLLIEEVGANLPIFLRYYGIVSLDELPAHRLAEATAKLNAKRATK